MHTGPVTLQEFSRDVVPIINTALGLLGLASLGLLWFQIRETAKWNKLQGQAAFLNRSLEDLERDVGAKISQYGIDITQKATPISTDQATRISGDEAAYYALKTLLNTYEDLAAGVRIGFVDEDFAYALESVRLVIAWERFEPFVHIQREILGDDELYIELENVAGRWRERATKDAQERKSRALQGRRKMGLARPKA